MMITLKKIFRFPIKGLPGEELKEIRLSKGAAIYGDRKFAIARHDTSINEYCLNFMKKTNFHALVKDEKLSQLKIALDLETNFLELFLKTKLCFSGSIDKKEDLDKLNNFFSSFLNIDVNRKPSLVRDKSEKIEILKHSFSDIPYKAISLISLSTIKDFENKIGKEINFLRFRGNFNFDGAKPWEEFKWLGKRIRIGTAEFQVFKKTERCRATTVNPDTGERDINIPFELNKHFRHFNLGVYCKVLKDGFVKKNDDIKIIS